MYLEGGYLMRIPAWPAIVAAAFVVTGCAGGAGQLKERIPPDDSGGEQPQAHAADSRFVPEYARIGNCPHTQRDLTVPWHRRRYWCGNDQRRSVLRDHNAATGLSGSDRHGDTDGPVPAGTQAPPAVPLAVPVPVPEQRTATASLDSDREMVRYLSLPEKGGPFQGAQRDSGYEDVSPADSPTAADNAQVWFAETRATLGPQGTRQALSLLSVARGARRVTLLGLYRPDELAGVKRASQPGERFSVARSLAVRELWRSEGLDVSKVTILHHRKGRPGRQVEVTFYD